MISFFDNVSSLYSVDSGVTLVKLSIMKEINC